MGQRPLACKVGVQPKFFRKGIMIISYLYDVTLIVCIMLKAVTITELSSIFCFCIIVKNRNDSMDIA